MWPDDFDSEFADFHAPIWEFFWNLKPKTYADPEIHVVFRGGGKSTLLQRGAVMAAARGARHYILFVGRTKDQAEDELGNVEMALESDALRYYYPALTQKRKTKFGETAAWRRNRLWTAAGVIFDAVSIQSGASRGSLLGKYRPDLIIPTDIDSDTDAPHIVEKLESTFAKKILLARAKKYGTVIGAQNLIWSGSMFSRLADDRAPYLRRRKVYGPVRAIEDLEYEEIYDEAFGRTRHVITGGEPTWEGFDLEDAQREIDEVGITAFLVECQHDVEAIEGGTFSHLVYQYAEFDDATGKIRVLPKGEYSDIGPKEEKYVSVVRSTVWVDPAVSNTKKSDAMGIQADSLGDDGKVYRRYSWERITSPQDALVRAITKAIEIGAATVGVETDQGGDTWRTVYKQAWQYIEENELVPKGSSMPGYRHAKAGSIGSKEDRASKMLSDYERGMIIHVVGTHQTLERALRRFPVAKPFDLVDASFWSWRELRKPQVRDLGIDANL